MGSKWSVGIRIFFCTPCGKDLLKFNIARINVRDVDSVSFEGSKNALDMLPVSFEGHGFHFFPIGPNFGRVIGRTIKIGTSKVQAKRWTDDGHFDGEQFVVVASQQRNAVPANGSNIQVLQPEENAKFPFVCDLSIVKFNGNLSAATGGLGWNVDYEYTTLSSNAQSRIHRIPSTFAVVLGSLFNFRRGHDIECSK